MTVSTRRGSNAGVSAKIAVAEAASPAEEAAGIESTSEEDDTQSDAPEECTVAQRRRTLEVAKSNAGPATSQMYQLLLTADGDKQLSTLDPSIDDLIELMLNCASASLRFFSDEELQLEAPTTIIDNLVVRADEASVCLSHVAPLQLSLLRELARTRQLQIEELFQQDKIFENHGLGKLNEYLIEQVAEDTDPKRVFQRFTDFVQAHDSTSKDQVELYKLSMTARFRATERLRSNLANYLSAYIHAINIADLASKRLPELQEWLLATTESKIRPLRAVGVFWTAHIGVGIARKLDSLQRDFRTCVEHFGTDRLTDKKRLTQIKDILRSANHLIRFLQDMVVPRLRERTADVSWLIQYEAVDGMSKIAQTLPIQTLLGNDRTYLEDFWQIACQHEVNDLRLLALLKVSPLLDSLLEALRMNARQDKSFLFEVPEHVGLADATISGLVTKIHTRVPFLSDHKARLCHLLEFVFVKMVKYVQDKDIRVALLAASGLSEMAAFDADFGTEWEVSLSDAVVTPAVSLLVHCDCPLVRHEVAKFVNKTLFAHNIINEIDVRGLLTGEEGRPDRSRQMEESLELRTFVSFLKEYATGPVWQSRCQLTVKAFWPLAPVLHKWDLLVDHLMVAFGSKPVQNTIGEAVSDSQWVDEECAEALLTLMLAVLECQRCVLCGSDRYARPPRFQPYNLGQVPRFDTERVLAELVQGGFRLSGGRDDSLWDLTRLTNDNRPFARRLTRNLMALWTCIGRVITGCRANYGQLLMALSIAYELVDATTALALQLVVVRNDLNFSDLILVSRSLTELCQNLARQHRDRAILKSVFAVLRKLRDQDSRLREIHFGVADSPFETYLRYLKDQQESIDDFFGVTRKHTLELLSAQAKDVLTEPPNLAENMSTMRGLLHLIATLAENDITNTFRHGLDALDDLVSVVEHKVRALKNVVTTRVEEEPSATAAESAEPSNLVTVLIFDALWLALAQWMEQIDQRFGAFILHDIRSFIGEPLCPSDSEDASVTVVKMEERLRLFREDLEIFGELQKQILGFAASCCTGFRNRAVLDSANLTDAMRKSDLISAVACVSVIVNASHFHATSSLWLRIEREILRVQRSPMRVTLSADTTALLGAVVELCQQCKAPSGLDSAKEVAIFADDLRLIGRSHRHVSLENDFPLPALTVGLWVRNDETPSSTPSVFQAFSVAQLFRNCNGEVALEALCQSLPSLPELAYTFHVQLMAAVVQLSDVSLWRNGLLGPVILHGLSSKSFVSQSMGVAFLHRLRSFEKARITEINLLAQQMGDHEEALAFLSSAVQPMILTELLLTTIYAAAENEMRQKHPSTVTNAERICDRASMALHPEYFVEMSDRMFSFFVDQVLQFIHPDRALPAVSLLMKVTHKHLLKGKIRRRWNRQAAQMASERGCRVAEAALKAIQTYQNQQELRKLEAEVRRFLAVTHPACKIPKLLGPIETHVSPSGLGDAEMPPKRRRQKLPDSDQEQSSSDTSGNDQDLLTSDTD